MSLKAAKSKKNLKEIFPRYYVHSDIFNYAVMCNPLRSVINFCTSITINVMERDKYIFM